MFKDAVNVSIGTVDIPKVFQDNADLSFSILDISTQRADLSCYALGNRTLPYPVQGIDMCSYNVFQGGGSTAGHKLHKTQFKDTSHGVNTYGELCVALYCRHLYATYRYARCAIEMLDMLVAGNVG